MAIVLHHSRATGTAKLVLLGVANHDGDGGAWPSVATLARYANVAPRNVQMALRKLEQLGELQTFANRGGLVDHEDHERPNLYRVLVECPSSCDRTRQHREQGRATLPGGWSPRTGGGVTLPSGGDDSVRGGGDDSVRGGGDASITRTTQLTTHRTTTRGASSALAAAPVDNRCANPTCADGWLGTEDRPSPCPSCRPTAARQVRRRRTAVGQ